MVSQKTKGILSILSGISMHLVLGSMYTWGSLLPYISSKLKHYDPGFSIETTLFFIPVNILLTNLFMPIGGKLDKILNKRLLLLIGTLLIAGGNIICAYGTTVTVYLIGDVVIGMGSGIVYMTPIKNGWHYFPDNKGMVSGAIVFGFGLSSFIFSFVSKAIVNPNGEEKGPDGNFPPDVFENVTKMFIWLGVIYGTLGLISVILFIPFQKVITREENRTKLFEVSDSNDEGQLNTTVVNPHEKLMTALCSMQFLCLFLMPFLTSTYGFFTVNALKLFGAEYGIDENTLTWGSSISGLANGVSRIFWGYILDKFHFKKTYYALCIFQLILASTIYFSPQINKYFYVIWCFLTLWGEGSHFTIFPTVTKFIFGMRNATEVYGIIFFAYSGGSFIGPLLTNYWVKGKDKIYYLYVFLILAAFNVISFVICYFFKYEEFDYSPKDEKKSDDNIKQIEV